MCDTIDVMETRTKKSFCKVPGCTGVSQLVRFPRNRTIAKQWLSAIKNPCLNRLRFAELIRGRRICTDHFEEKCFDPRSTIVNKILLASALPTLNLPGQPSRIKCLAHLDSSLVPDSAAVQVVKKPFLKLFRDEVLNLLSLDRYCVLLFKIVLLKPNLKYNLKHDLILGWQNANTTNQPQFAECALIFMVRGLYANWKQLISFVFCEKDISAQILIRSIRDVIATCSNLRLKITATVCDQSECNFNAMSDLKRETHTHCLHTEDELGYDSFYIDHEIIIMYDFPDLMQHICNEFKANSSVEFLIDDIQYVAQFNDFILYCKENDIYDNLDMFSSVLAVDMLDVTKQGNSFFGIGKFISFFVELLDSLSGVNNTKSVFQPFKCTVKAYSKHWDLWTKSIDTLNTMSFIDKNGYKIESKCLNNLITTLHGIMHLWRGVLLRNKFKSFTPKFLRLEPLTNDIKRLKVLFQQKLKFDITTPNQFTLKPNEFVTNFRKIMTNVPDTRLPLCDATRPLFLSICKSLLNHNFSNDDYQNFDQLLNKNSNNTLLLQSAFNDIKYEPVLNFNNKPIITSNKATFPIRAVSKCVANKLFTILQDDNCSDCKLILFGTKPKTLNDLKLSDNFMKAFWVVCVFMKYKLPKMYNKPNLNATLVNDILESGHLAFLNCETHQFSKTFVGVCVSKIILSWVAKLNDILSGKRPTVNSDYFSRLARLKCKKNKYFGKKLYVGSKNNFVYIKK